MGATTPSRQPRHLVGELQPIVRHGQQAEFIGDSAGARGEINQRARIAPILGFLTLCTHQVEVPVRLNAPALHTLADLYAEPIESFQGHFCVAPVERRNALEANDA